MNDIGLVTLLLDRPVLALPFAQGAELGGFILIDRTTQETVALGFVGEGDEAPSGGHVSAAPAQPLPRRLASAVARWWAPAGSHGRSLRYGQVAAHGIASLSLVLLLLLAGAEPALAFGVGLADLLLRPVVILGTKLAAGWLWRSRRAAAEAGEENAAGGGI